MSEDSNPQGGLTLADLESFLGMSLSTDSPQPAPPAGILDLTPYLDAAAVLAAFDPSELRPAHGEPDPAGRDAMLDRLYSLSEPIEDGPQRGLWILSFSERRAALRRLGTRAAMQQALDANPKRPDSPVQRMFERAVRSDPIELRGLIRDELAALLTVTDWVEGILDDLPNRATIRSALAMVDLLAPMQRLAGQGFVNRQEELEWLENYVWGPEPEAPLFVFGPGGVGKSALLAQFILSHAGAGGMAFAYLDTDRPSVRPDRPLTYLIEMIAQLRLQLELPPVATDSLVNELTFGAGRQDLKRQIESYATSYGFSQYLRSFADILGQSEDPKAGQDVVVVLDTFEEAQFLGSEVVSQLLDLAFEFRWTLPTFRVILAGRVLPPEFVSRAFPEFFNLASGERWLEHELPLERLPLPGRPMDLGVLDAEGAQELLQRSIQAAGLAPLSEGELADVIGIVGRNPMCLKLAARVLDNEGIERLREARSEILAQLKAEKIQALLYGRILHHVHGDEVVKKIAYPGLIVRRITPEVIREVLAQPCGLELTAARDEYSIFNDLSREAALVENDPLDGSLRHRTDVRRLMLQDLTDHVDPEVVGQIDRAAIDFYTGQAGEVARGEEIYHRLRLREPEHVLEDRWQPQAAVRLRNALEELPAPQSLWLAEKLGVTLDPNLRKAAHQEAWEDQAGRAASQLLRSGKAEEALAVLHERLERSSRSQLYLLEAEADHILGRLDEALRVSRVGVEALTRAGAVDMALELQLKMATIEEGRGDLEAADRLLAEAEAMAAYSRDDLLRLRVQITRLRVQRQLRPAARAERAELRGAALASLTDDMLYRLRKQPVLLRETAAELGKEDPRIAQAAIDTLGLEVMTDEQAQTLGRALAALNAEQDPASSANAALARAVEQFQESDFDPGVIRDWVTKRLSTRDTRYLGQSLGTSAPGSQALGDFRAYFRAGVDSAMAASGPAFTQRS